MMRAITATMGRKEWLQSKKAKAIERYETLFSQNYDENWGSIDPSHAKFVKQVASMLQIGDSVLDAACGTGKYWPMLLDQQLKIIGIDQSQGMLINLERKFPGAMTYCCSLQEVTIGQPVSAIICVDAMENVPPDDWPQVLANFNQSLARGGYLYFTVEHEEQDAVTQAYTLAKEAGLPVVLGEVALEGYHFYPQKSQVATWLSQAGFRHLAEEEGDGYWHLFCQKIDQGD